jgi:citrate synthase
MNDSPSTKIGRPRQIYIGPTHNDNKPIEERA